MLDFLAHLTIMNWVAISLLLMVSFFVWWINAHDASWFDFKYRFPIKLWGDIGKFNKLKKDTVGVANKERWQYGMPSQEATLCHDYSRKVLFAKDALAFKNAKEYLNLTYQNDVKPMPFWKVLVLFVLTAGEAMGTGFLIAPFIAQEMSSSEIGYAGWVIAVVVALILLGLTHAAGKSAKKVIKIKNALGSMDRNGRPHDLDDNSAIGPEKDQTVDVGKSAESRFFRRAVENKDRGSWLWPIVVAVLLSAIVAVVFLIRWEGIKEDNVKSVMQMEQQGVGDQAGGNPFAAMAGDNAAAAVPPDVAKNQNEVREKVANEIGAAQLMQGFGAAFLLAFIYVITQVFGFYSAFEHSFVGQGHDAYVMTRGEPDYQAYFARYVAPYVSLAEARLVDLRRHYGSVLPDYGKSPSTQTFARFLVESRAQGGIENAKPTAVSQPVDSVTTTPKSIDYEQVASRILALPEESRQKEMLSWIEVNGINHKDELKKALATVKERQKASQMQHDDEMMDLLKD